MFFLKKSGFRCFSPNRKSKCNHFDVLISASVFIFQVQNALFVYPMHRPHFHLPCHYLLWKSPFCGVYTISWRRQPPDCKYKHEIDLCALTVEQTSPLGTIHSVWKQECSIFINSPGFFSALKLYFALIILTLSGLFLCCSNADYPNVNIIYFAIHPFLGFCAARKKGPDAYYISWATVSKKHPDKQVAVLMWAPHGPDTPNLKLPSSSGVIRHCFPHQKGI